MLTARDGARDEAQKLHRKWMKHQAFMAELARNKEWLAKIEQEGEELIQEQPELRSVVEMKLKEIRECWSHLENTTKVKARQLFETQNHRTIDLPTNTLSDLDQHLTAIQEQPPTLGSTHSTQPTLLQPRPTFSQQLQRIQSMEAQMQLYQGVGEVRAGADHRRQEREEQVGVTETRIVRLIEPLKERRRILLASKELHQVTQDLEDEIVWIQDRLLLASSTEYGTNLQSVQHLIINHKALQTEMQAQRGRVEEVLERAEAIAALRTPEVELVREGAGHVRQLWEVLQVEMERRTVMLDAVNHAQQYYTQAAKAESWLSGQKLQVLNEEKGNALQSSFTQFSTETRAVGQKQMDSVNKMVNEMIDCSHSDAATIAEWKDGLNESWADLLELMETRAQMLAASYQLHKFFTDCQEVLVQIEGKMRQLPEVRSCQVSSANPGTLQRLLHSFEHSLQLLVSQVRQLQENAVQLRAIYAGEKADAILSREQEVMQAWKELLVACEGSRVQITTVTDKIQFFAVVRELNMWMDGIMGQIGSTNDARRGSWCWAAGPCVRVRDLSVLDGMMSQHQNLKSKIDNKSKNFVHCVEMGKMLLAARNPAAEEVKEKLEYIMAKQKDLNERWEQHWEKLQQAQQRLQSNQPGSAEQSWLTIKEPITPNTREAGGGTDEVEELIRRHEAFRKAASTWKDHFSSLRQAEKMKEELNKQPSTSSLLSRQMFPLSCLVPSSSSSSSSSSLFRNPLQDSFLESKPGPDFMHTTEHTMVNTLAQRLGSTLNPYTPVMNGSSYHGLNQPSGAMAEGLSYHGLKQQIVSGLDNSSYQGLNQQVGVLGVNSSSYTGLNQQGVLAEDSSSYHSLNHLGAVGVGVEPKMGYAWQHLKADCFQPKINHIHKAVPPLLEAHRAQLAGGAANMPAPPMGLDPSLEMIHSRLQRDPRGSRSDPQMDHLRREREYRLGRQTSSEQEIQARLNELPLIVRQERYRRRMERQSSSEQEGSGKQRVQKHDSSDAESGKEPSDKRPSGEKRSTMAEIVEQVQEKEACQARGEVYRPSSSLSAPVSRLDRPRARDRPKPRRRPRPKEPEEPRRSRSAPAQSVPSTPQPPAHTVQHEGFLYRKHEEEGKERSPNSKSWVNLFCVLKQGEIGFYKDSRHKTTPYNDEPLLNLAICEFDTTNGYKKKKNVFILRTTAEGDYIFLAKDEEDLKGWVNSINASLKEIEEIAKWEKATNSFTDPDKSERKERSEGAEPSEGAERSERSEKSERSDRSDKIEASDKSSEKRDTSEKERGDRAERGERGERGDRGSRGSSTSGKSK
ncbi:spectrin beta chain, non-erythrocytic 4-like [Sinocyclocheilus grahami]|nr:PREDICTED: spectrin beta chain, non-erythrocytic 4-like [Sinocyclocheilus grahami]